MNYDITDLRPTIVPKSDQLNAEQLLAGPMVVRITDVQIDSDVKQPLIVHYEGDDGRPFKPCLTMRKVLILAWGQDGRRWVGKSIELYCDPTVKYGGAEVGGVRISRMTDIPENGIVVSLTATKGKKTVHSIKPLQVETAPSLADVLQAIDQATNRAQMADARALAEKLQREELAQAQAAYKARVAALSAKAAE